MDENNFIYKEELWEIWLNSTTDYVYFKDLEGKYIGTSQSNAELAGLSSPDDMIGKYDFEIFPTEIAQIFISQDREVLNTGKRIVDRNWVDHPKLGKRLIECVKSPLITSSREVMGIQGISRDITDTYKIQEKMNEQNSKLQIILDNIPVAVWIKDRANHYITVNTTYEDFYGISKDDIVGHNVGRILTAKKLFSHEDVEILAKQDNEVMDNKITKKTRLWTEDKTMYVEITKSPIISSNGECVGLVGTCHDITDKN